MCIYWSWQFLSTSIWVDWKNIDILLDQELASTNIYSNFEKIFHELQNHLKEKQVDKYNEPVINLKKDDNQKGYSDNDNDSLDKLFNIESNN